MNRSRTLLSAVLACFLLAAVVAFVLQFDTQPGFTLGDETALPTSTPPPQTSREPTETPAGLFYAPAVFDTASTATLTPVPSSTSLYTDTPVPTQTPPAPPRTRTPTPVSQFFAPVVVDTASTATLTPVPTDTPLYTATPGPTMTFPAP